MKTNNFKADPATVNKSGLFKMKKILFESVDSFESLLSCVLLVLAVLVVIFLNTHHPVLFVLTLAGIVLNTGLQIGVFLGSLINEK